MKQVEMKLFPVQFLAIFHFFFSFWLFEGNDSVGAVETASFTVYSFSVKVGFSILILPTFIFFQHLHKRL